MYKNKNLFDKFKLGQKYTQNIWGNVNRDLDSCNFKKGNVKKISDYQEKIELVNKLKWKLGYVKKIKKFTKFSDIKKNELINKSIDNQEKHIIIIGEIDNSNEGLGLVATIKTPGKPLITTHILENELYICKNDKNSELSIFEKKEQFQEKGLEFTSKDEVKDILKSNQINLKKKIIKNLGDTEENFKEFIIKNGKFFDLD